MFSFKRDTSNVYTLVDQLEALLDIAENLRQVRFATAAVTTQTSAETLLGRLELLRDFASRVAILEYNLAAKLDQARYFARKVGRSDGELRNYSMLFVSGTQAVMDRLPDLADRARNDFLHTNETVTFLEERHLVNPLEASLDSVNDISLGEAYLVFGVVRLDAIEQLADSFLTAIDGQYGIYLKEDSGNGGNVVTLSAPLITSQAEAKLVATTAAVEVPAVVEAATSHADTSMTELSIAGGAVVETSVAAGEPPTAVAKPAAAADAPTSPEPPIIVEQPQPVRLIDRISRING